MSDGIEFACDRKNAFDKIGNGNSRIVDDRIELLAQHKPIRRIVLLVLRNEFGPCGLARLGGDDWAAVVRVNKEPDDSIYLLVHLVPFRTLITLRFCTTHVSSAANEHEVSLNFLLPLIPIGTSELQELTHHCTIHVVGRMR